MPQTLNEIRDLLAGAGLRPQKRLGQNFLIDGNLMTKIVDAAEIGPADIVLEVGAGTGSMTEMLLDRAGWVVAIEVDSGMFEVLAQRLAGRQNLTLVHQDVLRTKTRIAPEVLDALREATALKGPQASGIGHRVPDAGPLPEASGLKPEAFFGETPNILLVSNLPYHVASPLLADLLLCDVAFTRYCFSVQREVADRLTAKPSTKEYGTMSIVLQMCGTLEKITHIPPQAFWPAPKIESTALRFDIDLSRFPTKVMLQNFNDLVRLGFSHRRKTLNYNLGQKYESAVFTPACQALGIETSIRAEAISPPKWYDLWKQLLVTSI